MAGDANLVHLNDLNWDDEVLKSTVPVLVDFTAVWCGPCKVLSPIIQKLSDELAGKVKVGKLDIDESPATSAKYGIRGVPTVMVFVGGRAQSAARGPHQPRKPAEASARVAAQKRPRPLRREAIRGYPRRCHAPWPGCLRRLPCFATTWSGRSCRGPTGSRFHLRELIGEGGQGWIYKGNYDEPDGMPIVVKIFALTAPPTTRCAGFSERPTSCGSSARRRPNPNLVRFYDHGIAAAHPAQLAAARHRSTLPSPCSSTCTASRSSRSSRAKGERASPPSARAGSCVKCAWALTSVHAQNIVHRDLKPSNILVAEEHGLEVAKVTDFGLAKLVDFNVQKTDDARRREPRLRAARAVRKGQRARDRAHRRVLARRDRLRMSDRICRVWLPPG